MANEPVNPHDAFFKQYLSRPQVAADFLRRQLPPKNQVMPMRNERCEVCEGELEQRQVLARFRYKGETIYIEHVPAWVCRHCGEQYYDAPIYKQMERIAQQRERIHRQISFPLAEFEMALPT